jgi:hypothetical protein
MLHRWGCPSCHGTEGSTALLLSPVHPHSAQHWKYILLMKCNWRVGKISRVDPHELKRNSPASGAVEVVRVIRLPFVFDVTLFNHRTERSSTLVQERLPPRPLTGTYGRSICPFREPSPAHCSHGRGLCKRYVVMANLQ